ncbi:porin family protein [Flavobacterium sufflavum]|uniref:Porin family protein n=1 Tax=Flavobacterium sufflavum TaxID=1921138 RepID=A0A437KXY9_9FLAO|nr:outer membrane beta-barrel protein [Flavobacterium sufflavum]RVT77476.1 porin family protein [Flavobacterium sufflavum]
MKKVILSVLAVFAFGFANAQLREKGEIEIVPQIGVISANYYGGESGDGNSAITSASFGVGANYFFNDRWSLLSGLIYQPMGTEFSGFKDELKYVTIPVNASWHFGSTRKWNLNFGPSIGFLTSAKTSDGDDFKDEMNSTQIGLNVGIGYKIEISDNFSLLIDYQSLTGLTDAAKDFSFKNTAGTFNLGAVIKL